MSITTEEILQKLDQQPQLKKQLTSLLELQSAYIKMAVEEGKDVIDLVTSKPDEKQALVEILSLMRRFAELENSSSQSSVGTTEAPEPMSRALSFNTLSLSKEGENADSSVTKYKRK